MSGILSLFFVTFVAAFCLLKSTSNAQTALTSSEVTILLNAFSSPLNLTMGRKFLTKVRESEVSLCLNLTSNATDQQTSVADASIVSLHVRLANYTSIKEKVLRFPCLSCGNLTNSSPAADFVLNNKSLEDMTCLAASRFPEDFQITEQNPLRLSEVFSLALYDANKMRHSNLSKEEAVHLEMPLVVMPNNSRAYKLKCASRPFNSSQWSTLLCTTNQSLKRDNQTHFAQCNCSTLGYFAVFIEYLAPKNNSDSGGGTPAPTILPTTGPYASLSLSLDADCGLYLFNATTTAVFLNSTKYSIAAALNVSIGNITNMVARCGSIVVNFTLLSPDGTNTTLNEKLLEFSNLVKTDSYKVPVQNAMIWPLILNISANYNLTIPSRVVSQYYIKKTATTPTIKTTEIQPLVIDYTPFMISVAVILFAVTVCVCGTCCAHSWYLRKKKYTEFNSDKVKPKIQEPVVEEEEEEEVVPPEFPMTFTERPKVDEREMAKYDWARTSFAHQNNDTSVFVTSAAALGPRLIVDCDSDEESESPHPPGDVAINMEDEETETESSEGSGESTSEEDEEDYDPRNYENEDSFEAMEGVGEHPGSRASLSRLEEDTVQAHDTERGNEGTQEDNEGTQEDNEIIQEDNEGTQDDYERIQEDNDGIKEDNKGRQENNEGRQEDNEGRQEDNEGENRQAEEEGEKQHEEENPDDDVNNHDVTQDDLTQDDVIEEKDKEDAGTNEDPEGTPERAPTRGASSRMTDGLMSGMPEPSM